MIDKLKKNVDVTLAYSTQAVILIQSQKNPDKFLEEFEKEFIKNIEIGDRTILQYIINEGLKKQQEKKDVK